MLDEKEKNAEYDDSDKDVVLRRDVSDEISDRVEDQDQSKSEKEVLDRG